MRPILNSGFVKGLKAIVSRRKFSSSTSKDVNLEQPGVAVAAYFTNRCLALSVGYFLGFVAFGHPARQYEKAFVEVSGMTREEWEASQAAQYEKAFVEFSGMTREEWEASQAAQ